MSQLPSAAGSQLDKRVMRSPQRGWVRVAFWKVTAVCAKNPPIHRYTRLEQHRKWSYLTRYPPMSSRSDYCAICDLSKGILCQCATNKYNLFFLALSTRRASAIWKIQTSVVDPLVATSVDTHSPVVHLYRPGIEGNASSDTTRGAAPTRLVCPEASR